MLKKKLLNLAKLIFPIHRSITGEGNRNTLKLLKNINKEIKIKKIKTGQKVFDWTIPKEWKINSAFIIDPLGKKICDIKKNNLHIVSYSKPVNKTLNFKALNKKLHSIPSLPNAIPYVTSYYKEDWGFCIAENERKRLIKRGKYKVFIDSKIFNGELNYGEAFIKGKSKKEILISSYICHPSMANNEISGPVVSSYILKYLKKKKNKFSYRFIFIPETIGSITYLSKNYKNLKKNVIAAYNLSCIGDERNYSYLPSRSNISVADIISTKVLKKKFPNFRSYTWYDRGSDERQFCSPGIDLPMVTLMRTKYGEYKEYHTSLDKIGTVVTSNGLLGGYKLVKNIIDELESKKYPIDIISKPLALNKCEPFMTKRKLYPTTSKANNSNYLKNYMDILTYSDGKHSLLYISEYCKISIKQTISIAKKLTKMKMIKLN